MKKFFHFFIDNYKLSLAITFFIALAGALGLASLTAETYPPVDFPRVRVTTVYPGSSPQEVEEKITRKIEEEVRTVTGLKEVSSVSQNGRSEINILIDMNNYEVEDVVDELQRAVLRVQGLPSDIQDEPNFQRLRAAEIPIFELGVIGPFNERRRDQIADLLKEQFEDVKGVSTVRLSGFREREFQILLNRKKMQQYYVGIEEVLNAVRKRTQNIPAGYIRSDKEQKLVRVNGQVENAEEMGEIVVRSNFSGQLIRVKDIAKVKDGAAEPTVLASINGEPATIVTVSKKANADTIKTVEAIKSKLEEFKKNLNETDYKFYIFNDESQRVGQRLNIVVSNAIGGLILVLIILFIFLPGVLGMVTSLSLPICVLSTLAFMSFMGINFNTITMLALVIAIGMLVDNSVVISENYARLRDEGLSQLDAAVQAVHQFWLPITATAFTTIAAFVPMLVTKGVMGEFIKWIPIVVTFTLVVCLFESFILLPSRLRFTIRDKTLNKKNKSKKPKFQWFQWIQNKFEGFMNFSLRHRYIVSLFITMIMIFSFVLAKYGNRFELFPKENTEFYIARFEAPIETPLARTKKVAQDLAKQSYKLLGDTNVKYIISRSGVQQMGGNDPQAKNGDYVGMLIIVVPPDRARELETEWVLDKLRTIKDDRLTNLAFEAQRNGPPVGYPITITFRSSNYQKMRELINNMKDKFRQVDGVLDINDDEIVGGPEYNIQINEEQLSSLNLSTQAVGMALRTALQGSIASELSLNNKEFDLRIRYDEKDRETVNALKNTTVLTNSGAGARLIPLFNIANIEQVSGPSVRKRFDFQRAITLTGSVVPEKITSVQANQLASQWLKTDFKDFASEVTWKFGGEEENTKESVQSLFQALVLAFLGIFVILIFLFRSYSVPFLILSSIPLGLVGVFSAFFLHQKPLSFFALIGILGLAGVVVNAAIVLVSYIEELKITTSLNLKQVLAKASADRLRAVLITSLTTVGGLMPTAYGIGGSDPILVPMTLAMAWGLVSGTLLTLIWIPCGYMILEDIFSSKLLNRFTGSMSEPMVENNEGA